MLKSTLKDLSLKQVYLENANENSVSYSAFTRRLRHANKPNSIVYRTLVKEGLITPVRAPKKRKLTPFLAYDGEGRGAEGTYILLANRLEEIYNPNGLSSKDCLEFLSRKYPSSYIRIFYGFGYDVNLILRDLPVELWDEISEGIEWEGYRIEYIPGKLLKVNGYTYYDILPFFARGLLSAIKDVLHETDPIIEQGKSLRADLFEQLTIDQIREYNQHELIMTEKLADHLRGALTKIGLNLTAWYGPGAIAKKMFSVHKVQEQEDNIIPSKCNVALENAYYGGRFENKVLGHIGTVWEYDIHSAYPSVIAKLPYFQFYKHAKTYQRDQQYSLWRVRWDLRSSATRLELQPLPFRNSSGLLSFPLMGEGWYWQPEVAAALKYYGEQYFDILEGWIVETEGTPFAWVEELYYQRMELKDKGDASEYAIKVGINSLYGKTAQRVGSAIYFNPGWAGYITSATRAKLLEAYSLDPEGCIAFATDAIYSRRQIRGLQISDRLGDWEEKFYPKGGIFILPGLYVLNDGRITKSRIRGLPNSGALVGLLENIAERPYDIPKTTIRRFISNKLANRAPNRYGPYRCKFIDVDYTLGVREPKKRYYDFPNNSNGINYGALLTDTIQSRPRIFGVDRLQSSEEGEVTIPKEKPFDIDIYNALLEYPYFKTPKSVSRHFEADDDEVISFEEQEGEYIAELEPEIALSVTHMKDGEYNGKDF